MIENDLIIDNFIKLENLLIKFNTSTNRLLSNNLEETEKTDDILSERNLLLNNINNIRSEITVLIDRQSDADAKSIRNMLGGFSINYGLSEEEKNLHSKILDIQSILADISRKDDEILKNFHAKRDEIKGTLSDLQQERKKINFYNSAMVNKKGQTFDNQS